ncbi:hypothetical protein QJQ45_026604, partial [Haematococcus lacustris]
MLLCCRLRIHRVFWSAKQHSQGRSTTSSNPSQALTIATVATADRLSALQAQCSHWPGALSAAVYLPLLHTSAIEQRLSETAELGLQQLVQEVEALFTRCGCRELCRRVWDAWVDAVGCLPPGCDDASLHSIGVLPGPGTGHAESSSTGCALRVLLMTELVGDSLLRALLPINSLRNAALLAVDSPLVAMVDVDLLPSTTLVQAVLENPA